MSRKRARQLAEAPLFHLVARASRLISVQMTGALARRGLKHSDWLILSALEAAPFAPRTTELADLCGLQQPTATKSLDVLTMAGLVVRVVDPDDGRAKLLSLTDTGRTLATKLRQEARIQEDAVLRQLVTSGDARRLSALLQEATATKVEAEVARANS